MYKEITEYLEWKATHHLPASVAYKNALTRFVECCGEKGIEQYTIRDVVNYTNWLASRFANETVRYSLTILKNYFSFYKAQNWNCIPPVLIELPRKLPANSHRAIPKNEVQQIVSALAGNDFRSLRARAVVLMLWDTGVRVSELRSLDAGDLDMERRRAIIHTRKTSSARIILWSQTTQEHLDRYLVALKREVGYADLENTPLFIGTRAAGLHKRLTTMSIQRIVKSSGIRAGMKRTVTPHRYRHGWATTRRDEGAPLSFIQKGLGHMSPHSTQTYQQYSDPEFERKAFSYLTPNGKGKRIKIEELQHLAFTNPFGHSTP